jgi:hypothetical protein
VSAVVLTDPVAQPAPTPGQQEHANLALRSVLDAEIEALKARLGQRSAGAALACGLARADREPQVDWLRASLAKLQARRSALR